MPVDAFAPVLAISTRCDISASGAGEDLLIGSGSNLDVLSCDSNNGHRYVFRARYEIFAERRSNVHGIIQSQHYGDSMIVYGEKSIALVRIGELRVPKRRVVTCDDWIQTVALLDDGSLAVLFACNTIAVYHLVECVAEDSVTLQEYKRIRSSHKAVLFYSLLDGQTWPRLRAIVGTVFGDILVWHPSEGSNVSQRFTGHMGMIFGLLLRDNHLFSISDDRSLRMWSMKSFTQLDEAYGHFARPFAICDATEGAIITAGQDGDVCIWNTNGDLLSLVHRIRIGRGAIRAMLFHRNKIVLGTDGGLKCAIRMTPNLSPPYLVSRLTHKRPIRSFVHLSPTSYFVLDSNGILSILRDGEAKKVMECESARCDSLLLCPSERFVTLSSPRVLFVVSGQLLRTF
ncbi:WD repeat-containing protein 6 [Toxocara canis]|uniref:tRNA (34-2'-O)-methyltransferase regulator WDR6 n=1 Tax=Toxocara canis TaxID=6265 RepID=A0A0B2VPG1_TOXCA|nr:WD repeat-containing protein 6 [Toxocara canis]